MSTQREDGGPAFPLFCPPDQTGGEILPIQWGMSLRDWFAGQAIIALIPKVEYGKYYQQDAVTEAYGYADAMIAERTKIKTP